MNGSRQTITSSRLWSVVVTDAAGLISWELSLDGFASPARPPCGRCFPRLGLEAAAMP